MAKTISLHYGVDPVNATIHTFSISDTKYEQVMSDFKNAVHTLTFTNGVDSYTGSTFTVRADEIKKIGTQ